MLRPDLFCVFEARNDAVSEKMGLDGKLVLVGAGKMGGAMLEGWLASGLKADDVIVQDPAPPAEIAEPA